MSSPYQINRDKWQQLSIFEQMGNIYSEVGRTIKAKNNQDEIGFYSALSRALDLFDATIDSLIKAKSSRSKEVLRAKDQFLSVCFGHKRDLKDEHSLDQYFYHYALAARLNR